MKDVAKAVVVIIGVVSAAIGVLLYLQGTFNTKVGHRGDVIDTRMEQMEWRAEDNLNAAIREERHLRQWLEKHPGDRVALEDWNEAMAAVTKWTARQTAVENEKLKGGTR